MRKIIVAPGKYVQGAGEILSLADDYVELGSKKAYIIASSHVASNYHQQIVSGFEKKNIPFEMAVFGGECSCSEIDKHCKNLGNGDVIIGMGGGKVLDTAKAVAFYARMPVIIMPTVASNDAPCSRLSVIYKDNGEFESYLPLNKNPDMVIVAEAPTRFLAAGIGGALVTYYEASASIRADVIAMSGGYVTRSAAALARLCLDTLFKDSVKAMKAVECHVCSQALENLIEANIFLSGVGFESCGLAAAHAIHNGLTTLEECHKFLHGEKVAFGTLTQMVMEDFPLEEIQKVIRLCKAVGLPTCFRDLNLDQVSDERLLAAAVASCDKHDTMVNMSFEVKPGDVVAAMKVADRLGQ